MGLTIGLAIGNVVSIVGEGFLRIVSGPRWNLLFGELCTHIRPFIKTLRLFRWINLELRLDLLPLGFVTKLTVYWQLLYRHPYSLSSMLDDRG